MFAGTDKCMCIFVDIKLGLHIGCSCLRGGRTGLQKPEVRMTSTPAEFL